MKAVALVCGLLSGLSGMISALAFLWGSKGVPWNMRTWTAETEAERAIEASARWWNKIGLVALLVAFVLSTAASVASFCT